MTGDFGPPRQGPEPEKLTPESGTPDTGKPESETPADPAEETKGWLARLRGRTLITVVAAIVAVGAIAATSWALARHGGGGQATPNPGPTGTFGLNQPTESSSSSLPTFPTTFPTTLPTTAATTFPTTLPTFPTTYPTLSTTFPTYSPPPLTYPTNPITSTAPTTPTPTSTPTGNLVYPVSPVATPITKCGTHGSIKFVKTTGVRYELIEGDGRKGRWVVSAEARPRYELGPGATDRFSGNLGRFKRCPVVLSLRDVTTSPTGELATDPWLVKVRPRVPERERRDLSVTYSFATDVELVTSSGDGWSCVGPGEEPGSSVTCSFDGADKPPAVALSVRASDEEGAPVPPSGSVSLYADEELIDTKTFDASES